MDDSLENTRKYFYGGERGIRTLGAAINSTHDFQSCSFSQLGHLSVFFVDHQPSQGWRYNAFMRIDK
jgi:hypothetical protein